MKTTERMSVEQREHGFAVVAMRDVECSREEAYQAWTTTEGLTAWFMAEAQVDLRVDGEFRSGNGDGGRYLVVDPPHAVSFTWERTPHEAGSVVSLEFQENGLRTRVMLTHAYLSEADAHYLARETWDWAMDSFVAWAEKGHALNHEEWRAARATEGLI